MGELRALLLVVEVLLLTELDFNVVVASEDVEDNEWELCSKHEQPLDTRVVEHALINDGIAGCDVLHK